MSVRRVDDVILLEGVCAVEEAETLMSELLIGARAVDWSGCTHLHTACLQVILAAGQPVQGTLADPEAASWLHSLVAAEPPPPTEIAAACLTEA